MFISNYRENLPEGQYYSGQGERPLPRNKDTYIKKAVGLCAG